MRKFLLLLMLIGSFFFGKSQVVLNEVYAFPNGSNSEFIELYNSAVGSQNLNCFTVLTYWSDGTSKGWYVMELPDTTIGPKSFFTLAASSPYNVQGTSGVVAGVNWNATNFRNGSTGGYLRKFQYNSATSDYSQITLNDATAVNDLLVLGDFANGQNTLTLVFQDGVFINGFWAGGPTGTLPSSITTLPDLFVNMLGSCADFTINFSPNDALATTSDVGAVEFKNQAGGSDNGYARSSDGKCGSWVKTSSQVNHTPNVTNGNAEGELGSLTTAQGIEECGQNTGQAVVRFDITGLSGSVTEADDFPVRIFVYNDVNRNGDLDATDTVIRFKDQATVAAPSDTVKYSSRGIDLILVYKTNRGCFDKVISVMTECIALPVQFKSFNSSRTTSSNVAITWITATEQNSKGFNVQKNVGSEWKTIGFVPSQATAGSSSSDLSYNFKDVNNEKGITQYRIQQVDLDGKAKYSDIGAVRGDNTLGKVIVYPNPSIDGKLNVVFDDINELRDVYVNDLQGKVIRSYRNITNNNLVIEKLASGFYTIKINNRTTAASSVEKVVIK